MLTLERLHKSHRSIEYNYRKILAKDIIVEICDSEEQKIQVTSLTSRASLSLSPTVTHMSGRLADMLKRSTSALFLIMSVHLLLLRR